MTTSPFDQALSPAERALLAPVLGTQYLGAEPVIMVGTMTRVWRRHRWLTPVFRLLSPLRMLFAETGTNIPTTLKITPERDMAGRPVQRWQRTFSFPGADRHFDGLVAWDERLGQVVERLGPKGVLDSAFRLHVRPGGLLIEAGGLRVRIAGRAVPLPGLLGASVRVDQEANLNDADAFHVNLTIAHPILGPVFGYEGNLRLSTAGLTQVALSSDRSGSLIYDEDCGLCVATAAWLAQRVGQRQLELLTIGDAPSNPKVGHLVEGRPLLATLHFVRADDRVLTGAAAVLAAGRLVPRWRLLASLFDNRVGHVLLEPLYRQISSHRRRIALILRLPAACPLPPRPREQT